MAPKSRSKRHWTALNLRKSALRAAAKQQKRVQEEDVRMKKGFGE
jgi:hypothetical protein